MRDAVKTTLTVFIAFFLALRVVAQPAVLSSPEPGVMALCTGGQIVYLSVDGPMSEDAGRQGLTDPCPFFGIKGVPAPLTPPLAARPDRLTQVAQVEMQGHDASWPSLYAPGQRAPPFG